VRVMIYERDDARAPGIQRREASILCLSLKSKVTTSELAEQYEGAATTAVSQKPIGFRIRRLTTG